MKQFWENLTRPAPVKALWWLLLAAALFGGLMSGRYLLLAAQEGCYDPEISSYYDTQNCRGTATAMAQDVLNDYLTDGAEAALAEYGADQSNARFRISVTGLDGIAHILCDTMADREARDICRINFQMQANSTAVLDYTLTGITMLDDRQQSSGPAGADTALDRLLVEAGELDEYTTVLYDGVLEFALADPLAPGTDQYTYASWADQELWAQCSYFIALQSVSAMYPIFLVLSIIAGLLSAMLLLAGAGRSPGRADVALCWFDRIPMELTFFGIFGGIGWFAAFVLRHVADKAMYFAEWIGAAYSGCIFAAAIAASLSVTLCGLLAFAWIMAFARSAKSGHAFRGFWSIRLLAWLAGAMRQVPAVPAVALGVAAFGLYNGWIGVVRHYNWIFPAHYLLLVLLWAVALAGSVYLAVNLRTLQKQAERIAAGDYETPVDTRYMLPPLRRHAKTLENIGAGMNTAVEQRMKSERLKTELITNVSHDLKTPLTSIINYTDLLQQEELPARAAEYAAVLARQGERLKKLTEDLIEASKASSGAMPCQKAPTNLCELCEQAVGEYAEKLETAGLTPLLDLPGDGLYVEVDGRLTWRVLDNLLNNACKYAMPGTRLYLTGRAENGEAVLTLKNISREPLNISAQELTERFVRGDSARASEGSGLGLSIVQSLTELQGGRFSVSIDGDLFKAAVAFPLLPAPAAEPSQLSGEEVPAVQPAGAEQ